MDAYLWVCLSSLFTNRKVKERGEKWESRRETAGTSGSAQARGGVVCKVGVQFPAPALGGRHQPAIVLLPLGGSGGKQIHLKDEERVQCNLRGRAVQE